MSASDITELNLIVGGNDKRGRPWTVYIEPPREIAPGYAWAADLNADGADELIFDMSQGGSGWCVGGSKMTVLSLNGEGRPVPWLVKSFIDDDYDWRTHKGKGVQDFGDWNKNGRTELVQIDCDTYSDPSTPPEEPQQLSEVSGIADVYELDQGFWRRLSPADRAKYESAYRKFAASMDLDLSPKDSGTFIPDYSNDPAAGVTAHILSTVPAVGDEGCGVLEGLEIENGQLVEMAEREKEQLHARCSDHFVIDDGVNCFSNPAIVLYSPKETIAVMNGSSDRAVEILQQIVREKLPVRLTGQMEEGRCSPAMIWATQP